MDVHCLRLSEHDAFWVPRGPPRKATDASVASTHQPTSPSGYPDYAAPSNRPSGCAPDLAVPASGLELSTGATYEAPHGLIKRQRPAGEGILVGRAEEIGAIRRLLKHHRSVALHGIGGVGKTRLALEVARRVFGRLERGAYFVALPEATSDGLATLAICQSLGIHSIDTSPEDAIAGVFAESSGMLVIDGDDRASQEVADLCERLLLRCPKLLILTTSRRHRANSKEVRFAVLPLETSGLMGRPSQAAQLFISRAQRIVPAYRPEHEDVEAIEGICRALDGLPLAIELVAAHVQVATPREFPLLTRKLSELAAVAVLSEPQRHEGLWASLRWTHSMCTQAEQAAWSVLAAFDGPFTPAAAASVLTPERTLPEALSLLTALVEHSLLRKTQSMGTTLYEMLATTRDYGRSHMGQSSIDTVRERIADYAERFCVNASRFTVGPSQDEWTRQTSAELPSIRLAVEVSLSSKTGQRRLPALLAESIQTVWWANGLLLEAFYWHRRVVLERNTDPEVRAYSLAACGVAAQILPQHAAGDFMGQAEQLARELHIPALTRRVMADSALAKLFAGEADIALQLALEGLAVTVETPASVDHLRLLQIAAEAANSLGDAERASAFARQTLFIVEPLGERWYRSLALRIEAVTALKGGDAEAALGYARHALAFARATGARMVFTAAIATLLPIFDALGDDERAAVLYGAVDARLAALMAPRGFTRMSGMQKTRESLISRLGQNRFRRLTEVGRTSSAEQVELLAQGDLTAHQLVVTVERGHGSASRGLLTTRELEVAGLIARGLSNAEIASALFLSRRTVEGHVDRSLRKLGLTSRTQLAAWSSAGEKLGRV